MASRRPDLEFFYDISCPFAYIASTRVEELAARVNANLIWTPVLLGAIYRLTAAPQGAAGSASDVFNSTKKAVASASFARTLKRYQVPYNPSSAHIRKTTTALRLLHHVPNEERPALTKALYHAYWIDGADVTKQDVLLDIAKRSNIASARNMSRNVFETQQDRKALEDATNSIVEKGSPGVPAFWIKDEVWTDGEGARRKGRLYWGQDRMLFVEAVLRGLTEGKPFDQTPSISTLHPRCVRSMQAEGRQDLAKLEFWFDFSSPWAFLGWTQLDRFKQIFGNRLEIEMKPMLLGALFREIGAPMVPMMAISQVKRNYNSLDLADWVRYWNAVNVQEHTMTKPIQLRFPDVFPIRSPTLLRCAILDPKCIPLLYRACWEQNLDISDDEVLSSTLSAAGFNASEMLKQASTQRVKDVLRRNTQEAKDLGICGAPSYRVFHKTPNGWEINGGVVWGQDETNVVQDLICGWNEDQSQDVARVGPEHEVSGRSRL